MKEVSCRILEMFFRELQKKGLPAARLVDGVGYSVEHVQDKHERIDWVAFVRLMENAREIWSAQELVEMGGAWIDSPFLRHTRLIAGALFTPKQLYRWFDTGVGETSEKRTRRGLGVQMFTCVTNTVTDLGPDRVRLEVVLDEGYPPCPAFFLLTKGGYVELPRLVGKGRALVDMTLIDRGARYDVTLPPGSNRRSIVRRAVRWVAAPMDAARELDETHAALQMRYEQLEAARATLALQATQLRTAHTVNELVQKNLDLDLALATIADALVKEAGFARARLEIDTEVDGLTVLRSIERGQGGATPLERKLEGHGGHRTDRLMGRLIVYPHARADVKEREELLAFIVPSIAMALDNAVSYLVVEEYRRGLELRVAERTAELTKATAALAETVRDLEEAKQMRDRIFANVNHDLRSPLSLVLLSVDEAQNLLGELSPAASRALATVEHGTRRVLRMVDELLLLAEGREGELHISMVVCDLGAMVEAAVEAWKPAARAARITLDHEVEKGVVTRADPNAFERILANLLSNAIKFTPAGAGVQVAFSTTEDRAILEVRDDGPGIEAELRVRLFGRFERGSKARASAIGGSGLGLSLVKALAEAHGGTVSARNAESGGAAFRVELPLSRDDIVATEIMSPKISHRPADYGATETRVDLPSVYEPKGTPRATVLLAEDDPDLRDRTAKVLATEYRVLAAADGIRALELAKLHAPDLLITDIAMPGLDGVELTRRFRALHVNRVAPVLVLTTFGGVHDKLAGFEAGAVDYIHKPFEPSELRARVRSQLALRALALQLLETEKLAALGTLSAGLAHEI
ncbi:MAG TPA: ATP-binding protein, partial [Labilithrix sp.]|nr:ATP-binding protein [Labilithrix sp.]